MNVPAFTAYGLSGGTFLGTEAASALLLYTSKVGTFAAQNALSTSTVWRGVLVGAGIMFGTLLSKPLVIKLPAGAFEALIDGMLIVSGAALVWAAL